MTKKIKEYKQEVDFGKGIDFRSLPHEERKRIIQEIEAGGREFLRKLAERKAQREGK